MHSLQQLQNECNVYKLSCVWYYRKQSPDERSSNSATNVFLSYYVHGIRYFQSLVSCHKSHIL